MLGRRLRAVLAGMALLVTACPRPGNAYSVFTHEQLIDLAWDHSIRPLLLARFPAATPAEIMEAHAYAYGGSAIQDAGYYPFGHEFFSDLTHYVRTGEFIGNLLRNAQTVDEFAFAIGALSHYLGDNIGHQDAINPSTAIEFPSLEKKFGPVITYDQSPHSHVRTEFAFDIDALSRHRFAPAAYLRLIGMGVPRTLLEKSFQQTYGLTLREVLGPPVPALRSYRSSVRNFLPRFAYAEVVIHRRDFPDDLPTPAFAQYQQLVTQVDQDHGWERYRKTKPSLTTRLLVIVIRIVPKVGFLSYLAIRGPSQLTQNWYVNSVNRTLESYTGILQTMTANPNDAPELPDRDLDTGYAIEPGAYRLTDSTYAKLLHQLTSKKDRAVPTRLRQNILDFYADPNAPIATRRDRKAWARVLADLELLKKMPVQA